MHTVDKVYVGVTRRAKHHLGAGCAPFAGVAGAVSSANIGFGFHNQPAQTLTVKLMDQPLPQQIFSHGQGGPAKKRLVDNSHSQVYFPRISGS